jgi:hypothetical protein
MMSTTRPLFALNCLTIALVLSLSACAPYAPTPRTGKPSVDERLSDPERRVDRMEARPEVAPPYRSKEEIQANISELEEERGRLLISYTPQHPAIRDIDRELSILNSQLKMLQ